MLRRDPGAGFVLWKTRLFRGPLFRFRSGSGKTVSAEFSQAERDQWLEAQETAPLAILYDQSKNRRWWMFQGEVFWEDEGYTQDEVEALILDRWSQREKRIQRARSRAGITVGASGARDPIPDDVRVFVWQRDGGRCVNCGSQENLEFDHIIPVSRGGSNTARNIQLLCEACNRAKGGNLV